MRKRTDHAKLVYIRAETADELALIIAHTTPAERGEHLHALALANGQGTATPPPRAVGHPATLMYIRAETEAMLDCIVDHTKPDERGRALLAIAQTRAQGEVVP